MELAEIKEDAKNMLEGKKLKCALVALIPALFEMIIAIIFHDTLNSTGLVPTIVNIFNMIIVIFLNLGCLSYFLKLSRNEEVEIGEVFSKGSLLIKALLISICTAIAVFAGTLLFIIPGIILAFSYSMIEYIILDNPDIGIIESMTKSRYMMKGHKWEYFCLGLNIIAWPLIILIITLIILAIISSQMFVTGTLLSAIIIIGFTIYYYVSIVPLLYIAISMFYNNLIENTNDKVTEEVIDSNEQ